MPPETLLHHAINPAQVPSLYFLTNSWPHKDVYLQQILWLNQLTEPEQRSLSLQTIKESWQAHRRWRILPHRTGKQFPANPQGAPDPADRQIQPEPGTGTRKALTKASETAPKHESWPRFQLTRNPIHSPKQLSITSDLLLLGVRIQKALALHARHGVGASTLSSGICCRLALVTLESLFPAQRSLSLQIRS